MSFYGPGGYIMPGQLPPAVATLPNNPLYTQALGISGRATGLPGAMSSPLMLESGPLSAPLNVIPSSGIPFEMGARSIPGAMASEAGAIAPEAASAASNGLLSRIPFLGDSMSGLAPWAADASFGAKVAGVGTALLPTFGGQVAGNLFNSALGGNASVDKNPFEQFGRGALKGAGVGATVGLLGGPFDPITVPAGTAIGAIGGGLMDLLNVGSLFKSKDNSVKNYQTALGNFNNLLNGVTGQDSLSRDYINRQLSFKAAVIASDPSMSDSAKAKALMPLIQEGQTALQQYVANPNAIRQLAQNANSTTSTSNGQASPYDQMAMQAAIAKYTNPIADQIEATGKQQAALYGERGGQIGGERGSALSFQGNALAAGAKQVADAYRAQAQLMPAKYIYDQYGIQQPTGVSRPTQVSSSQLATNSAAGYQSGYPSQSSSSGYSNLTPSAQPSQVPTNSTMNQLLSQFNAQNAYGTGGIGG